MKNLILSIVLLISSTVTFAGGFPDKIGVVNDYEGVLTSKQEKTLTKFITKNQTKTNIEMIVVSTKDFKPAPTIKKFVVGLLTHWGYTLNTTKKSVLVLFSLNKKGLKIIPSDDIVSILTEKKLLDIVKNVMEPKFLKEKYFSGLKKGIKTIYKTIKNYQAG